MSIDFASRLCRRRVTNRAENRGQHPDGRIKKSSAVHGLCGRRHYVAEYWMNYGHFYCVDVICEAAICGKLSNYGFDMEL